MAMRKGLFLTSTLVALQACQGADEGPGAVETENDGDTVADVLSAAEGTSAAASTGDRATEDTFVEFESGQVRPLALSHDGRHLFAVNTPDNRLEIFKRSGRKLRSVASVFVGMEPVAVAVRNRDEVWVVNHVSDSISVVDVRDIDRPRVKRTLLVGDEPRDIVFAGPQGDRAFITTAHRGQNTGRDPQLSTPGVGRADVWVFDANDLGETLQGTPLTVITLFADTPRALAVAPDRSTVYAAAFHSGNRTTTLPERIVTNFGGLPGPTTDADGAPAPWNGLIVKYRLGAPDGEYHWLDGDDRIWDHAVNFSLPDQDVFAIDATLPVPAQRPGASSAVSGVGTVLFNMAVNPVSGKVYVSNLESFNDVRFEGRNEFAGTGSVRGHVAENRITVIEGGQATPRHLNKHIDYDGDGSAWERRRSLAFPTGMEVSSDGKWLYVAALGSSKLGIYNTAELEADTFVPSTRSQVELSGGGPTGVALDDRKDLAYVLTRFDNGISVVDLRKRREIEHVRMYNPEPRSITRGRPFLYDGNTSSHGDSACASCHVFGDLDSLAWDLGDPDASVVENPGPFTIPQQPFFPSSAFHGLKGPMTTQSLRGLANHGPMHWRGDRTGGIAGSPSAQPDTGSFDEVAAFNAFNVAFDGLLGLEELLPPDDMQAFTDFTLQIMYPPNPIRSLDNSLTPGQQAAQAFYFNHAPDGTELPSDTFRNCNGCHVLDPSGNAEFGVAKPGFFGSDGTYSFDNEPQFFKVPHLRNLYQKVGMFGMGHTLGLPVDGPVPFLAFLPAPLNDDAFQGDQIRGFGFTHDGSVDTLYRFLGALAFVHRPFEDPFPNPFGITADFNGIVLRKNLESFLLSFDSNLAPIVGQQTTLTKHNRAAVEGRILLMKERAEAGECELVVHLRADRERGYLYQPESGTFRPDRSRGRDIDIDKLMSLAAFEPLTFTAVPVGSGVRVALDRDSDGRLNGDSRRGGHGHGHGHGHGR